MGFIICISGPDGAGKSTVVNYLKESLIKNGVNIKTTWMRYTHFFCLPLLLFCRVIGLTVYTEINKINYGQWHFYKSPFISSLFSWILLIDLFFFTFFKIYVPMLFGKTVIVDRFILDIFVDTIIATKKSNFHKALPGRLFLKIAPRNCNTIVLYTDSGNLKKRRLDLKYDPLLDQKCLLYKKIAKDFGIEIIDTSVLGNDLLKKILDKVYGEHSELKKIF